MFVKKHYNHSTTQERKTKIYRVFEPFTHVTVLSYFRLLTLDGDREASLPSVSFLRPFLLLLFDVGLLLLFDVGLLLLLDDGLLLLLEDGLLLLDPSLPRPRLFPPTLFSCTSVFTV